MLITGPCLSTSEYAVSSSHCENGVFYAHGDFTVSAKKFLKVEDTAFIFVFGRLISSFDQQTSGAFEIQYVIPDDIDIICFRGASKTDLKTIWTREVQSAARNLPGAGIEGHYAELHRASRHRALDFAEMLEHI